VNEASSAVFACCIRAQRCRRPAKRRGNRSCL